ncbi:MAG: type I-A CRISPR-associated protein Cas7/Csa2 [Nitrososphaerota archaeon]
MKGFLSLSLRLLINVESLNGVESIGNLSRHRTVPIVVKEEGQGYVIRFVPAISGESIAHAYQELLVKFALEVGLNVGKYSRQMEFLKFTDENILKEEGIEPPKDLEDIRRAEADIIHKDIVADIGGFLYAGDYPIKRTSRFQVGYMIPAQENISATALEAQFHVRHVPSEMKKGKAGETRAQIPYNIEVGSAVYTLTFNLDLDGISRVSTRFGKESKNENELEKERPQRIKIAMRALTEMLSSLQYGAKRTRFLPNVEPLSAVAAYSEKSVFIVSPGNFKNFIKTTQKRSQDYQNAISKIDKKPMIKIICFDKEGASKDTGIEPCDTLESFASTILDCVLKV